MGEGDQIVFSTERHRGQVVDNYAVYRMDWFDGVGLKRLTLARGYDVAPDR